MKLKEQINELEADIARYKTDLWRIDNLMDDAIARIEAQSQIIDVLRATLDIIFNSTDDDAINKVIKGLSQLKIAKAK